MRNRFARALFLALCLFIATPALAQQPKLVLPLGLTNSPTDVAFSPDETKLATYYITESLIKIWDVASGSLLQTLKGHTGGISSIRFSDDGKTLISTSFDETLKVWDVKTGSIVEDFIKDSGETKLVRVSPDATRILTAYHTIKIWDAKTKKLLNSWQGHDTEIESAQFSNDNSILLTNAFTTIKAWNTSNGSLLYQFSLDDWPMVMKFSPDNKKILTVSYSGVVTLTDALTGKKLGNLNLGEDKIYAANFSPDSKKVFTISSLNGYCAIWDCDSRHFLQFAGYVNAASFSPDSKSLLVASRKKTVKIINLLTEDTVHIFTGSSALGDVNYSPSGKLIVSASVSNVLAIFDAKSGALLTAIKGHADPVKYVRLSPDGKKMVASSGLKPAKIWDMQTGRMIMHINEPYTQYGEFSPDGKQVVTVSLNAVKFWDAETGGLLKKLNGNLSYLQAAHFSPDGKKILTTYTGNIAEVWDVETGNFLYDLVGHTKWIESAEFSHNGQKIVTASQDGAIIWDADTKAPFTYIPKNDHAGYSDIYSAVFSPDDTKLLITESNGMVKLCDVATGALLNKYELDDYPGSANSVFSAQFSGNGTDVLLACADGSARVWNTLTNETELTLSGHDNWVYCARFSPDGSHITTCSYDNTCKLWDAKTGRLLYTFFSVDSTDYIVYDSLGRYDGTEDARRLINFTCGDEVIGLDQVKDQLWVPGLAQRIIENDSINAPKIADLAICGFIPIVENLGSSNGYAYKITPRGGGLGETVLYVNGIEIKRYKPEQLLKTPGAGYQLNIKPDEVKRYFADGQQNAITVKAYAAGNSISSRGVKIVNYSASKTLVHPNLFAVMIGVSDYKGEELDLKYAAKDAADLGNIIGISARKLFNTDTTGHVFVYNLVTDKNHYLFPEKQSIKKVLDEIGQKASANDILLIFFAGHGVVQGDKKQFFFLTADASKATAVDAPGTVGIGTEELSDWIKPQNIKAQKRILIFDACNSGQAINELVKIGSPRQNYIAARNDDKAQQIKTIEKLNEKTGMFILSASASNQSAYEMERYAQGLLTYSLLKAIREQPGILEDNKFLDVSKWFNAAEKTVDDMSAEMGGLQQPQIVSAGNISVGIVDTEVVARIKLPQEKALFTECNFQNNDEAVADDDLSLNKLVNNELNYVAAGRSGSTISYLAATNSPDAYSLSGRYDVLGNNVTIKVNIKQNKALKFRFEFTAGKNDLQQAAVKIVQHAVDFVNANRDGQSQTQ